MSGRTETAIVEVILKGQAASASLKEIERSAAALRAQLKRLPVDSEEFEKKTKELQNVNGRLNSIRNEIKGTGGMFQWLSGEVKQFGILAAGYLGFQWLSSSVKNIISSNAELSDSLADIRKTTGMTDAEVKKLNTSLSQIDTRTPTKELRQIAIGAGQLGIAKGDVLNFTTAVDKMVVSLGDEFTGGASEVTKVMGGLRNIFSDIKTNKVDQDLLHIGNAINELASAGAATGPVVADFANRIGGVGISLGLTSGQVLGMSATLQELNVSTERGGTAVVKILQKMTTNIDDFAKVAGMKSKDFAELVNRDIYGALIKVVEGSKKSGDSATALGAILDKLGVDGAGASEVISKLGGNTDLLKSKVLLANSALGNTNSIMSEFRAKNSTLGAEMDRLSKGMASAFTNSAVTDGLKSIVGWMADLFDKTKSVSQGMEEERTHVNALVQELKSSNVTQERRLEIYDELEAINPSIVAGIDRENISIERLTQNVIKYNHAQIGRIAVQKKQEEIDKAQEKAAEMLTTLSERQSKAYEALGKIQEMNGIVGTKAKKILDDENLSITEKVNLLGKLARAEEWKKASDGSTIRDQESLQIKNILATTNGLNLAEFKYNELSKVSAMLMDEKTKLMKQLGIETEGAGTKMEDLTKKTVKQLNDMLVEQKLSRGIAYSKEMIKAIHDELDRRNKQSEDKRGLFDAETNRKILDARKKLLDELAELERKNAEHGMSDRDKEEKHVMDKYYAMLKKVEGNAKQEMIIRTAMINDLDDIDKKYYEKALREKEKYLKDRERIQTSAEVNEINDTIAKYDELIALAQKYGEEAASLEHDKWIKVAEIKEKYKNKGSSTSTKAGEKDELQLFQEDLNTKISLYQTYYSTLADIVSSFNQMQEVERDMRLSAIAQNHTEELEREKRLLNAKLISQSEYDRRVARLEVDKEKQERKIRAEAAEKQKQTARYNTILHGIEAIAQIWAKHAANPIIAGSLSALAAGGTFARLMMINSEPVPQYATGGFTEPSGYINKATLFSSSSGAPFIAGEAGAEWIAPNWMLRDPVVANQIQMLEAIRAGRTYANGGYNSTATGSGVTQGSSSSTANSEVLSQLTGAINRLNTTLENGIEAGIVYDDFKKTMSGIENAAKLSSI